MLSVVQAVAIGMVHDHIVRDFEYLAVHGKLALFSVLGRDSPGGVKSAAHFCDVPFVFDQVGVIVGVDDGVLALTQWYPAKGIAVPNPPIGKHQPNERCQKPGWYFESNADYPASEVNG